MSEFRAGFESCLAELEEVTAELRGADPDEVERVRALLGRRAEAIRTVATGLEEAAPRAVARAESAWRDGKAIEERLKLVQAAARDQLREIYRLQFHLKAVSADLPSGSRVELEG